VGEGGTDLALAADTAPLNSGVAVAARDIVSVALSTARRATTAPAGWFEGSESADDIWTSRGVDRLGIEAILRFMMR
jgi:hypothetical protein